LIALVLLHPQLIFPFQNLVFWNLFEILIGRNHLKNQYLPQIFFFFGDLKNSADFIFEEKVANGENSP